MRYFIVVLLCAVLLHAAPSAPLQTFTIKEPMNHQWTDELVHFDFNVASSAKTFTLTDAAGTPLPTQLIGLTREKGRVKGTAWTVLSLAPNAETTVVLRPGTPDKPAETKLKIEKGDLPLMLVNEKVAVIMNQWPGILPAPINLTELRGPVGAICQADGKWNWLGGSRWVNDGPPLSVKSATTTILEQGPVRVCVEQKLIFTDDKYYRMVVELAAGQDTALITEDSDVDAPKAGFRFLLNSGLNADRLYWCSNYWREPAKGLVPTAVAFDKENVICSLCPWSFWWDPDLTAWLGAFKDGEQAMAGVLVTRPSRWSPDGWDGFARTRIPVTARPGGTLDLTFGLLAMTRKDTDGKETFLPLHREWALTAGTVADNVTPDAPTAKLRHQLVKYSEFPLDAVKDFGFDYTPSKIATTHPFLIATPADIARVRKIALAVPSMAIQAQECEYYINTISQGERVFNAEGEQAFYQKVYMPMNLADKLPQAFIYTGKEIYGKMLAAAVKGIAQNVYNQFLEKPLSPCIGRNGPWQSDLPMRLLLNYDLIAGTGVLTSDDERFIRNALVFSAFVLDHPDYWNREHGLYSPLANMTSSIILPKGLLGLYLDGHPKSPNWLHDSEEEIAHELQDWVSPGGAWIENPGYQAASLDGMFLLAQGLKNVKGVNYFNDPQFKATMDYYGYILTPPDLQFPPKKGSAIGAPMTLPGIGDGFPGYLTPFNGWIAANTQQSDPAFSARQQWFWNMQQQYVGVSTVFNGNDSSGRARGFTSLLVDPTLPATPPEDTAKAFPGFGSVLRTSWTDPRATYLLHHTGPNVSHYHYDTGEILLYAKGAPLCLDFGNDNGTSAKLGRIEQPWMHSLVSFDPPHETCKWGPVPGTGKLVEVRGLRQILDYSHGVTDGTGNQQSQRYVLLVNSADPLGANYVVMRDVTKNGQANQRFYWNLWCVGKTPEIAGNVIHFPGLYGVDLDVYMLSPTKPVIETDHISLEKNTLYVWGVTSLEQYGIHVRKDGSAEDFLAVLYPRAAGQAAATVTQPGAKSLLVKHMEGTDLVLLSPGTAATVEADGMGLGGEVALARRYADGRLRLAILKGNDRSYAGIDRWGLASTDPAAIEVNGDAIIGECSGAARVIKVTLPAGKTLASASVDSQPVGGLHNDISYEIPVPAGNHTFKLTVK